MKEEIVAGLKNALERGYSLEEAIQSFINAGYNASEVREGAAMLTQGASQAIRPIITKLSSPAPEIPQTKLSSEPGISPAPSAETQKPKKALSGNKILLIGIIVLLVVIAGAIVMMTLFRDQTMNFIKGL